MEQTIRERRFASLSNRRNHSEGKATATYEPPTSTIPYVHSTEPTTSQICTRNSTASSPSLTPEITASTSVESLSDLSVTTPSGIPTLLGMNKSREHRVVDEDMFQPQQFQVILPTENDKKKTGFDVNRIEIPNTPSPKPVLVSSLSKASDFVFDRYSRVIEVSQIKEAVSAEEHHETYSPIETATPISYLQPKSRPSVVSIYHVTSKDPPKSSPPKPVLPERNAKRFSTTSVKSGFLASEATPFKIHDVPDLPPNALHLISNASRESLTQHHRPVEAKYKLAKKGSMALLSKALKFGHSRLNSRANSVSPPATSRPQSQHAHSLNFASTSSPRPVSIKPIAAMQSRPQTATVPITAGSSRPQTATNRTSTLTLGVTALPPCAESLVEPASARTNTLNRRKKSISALRSRSDSIGQALKSASSTVLGQSKGKSSVLGNATNADAMPAIPAAGPSPESEDLLLSFPVPPPTSVPVRNSVVSFSRPLRNSSLPTGVIVR